ncbi:DUF4127 family protein [Deinococcus yavapaiensis]|uniref:Uncharacterized protein DUF4127 n=1 Tax=Deinococcus yavapaiensis KR-236 TaxID=694435 RepID=A0A318S6S8_9DEIO|nr:DUF4127 family protein [Deinococcus yavapaiensis]PYE54474.1 uncharacterized protein DUF4127 [Deinococcus yavapaiensis KR-236]
MKAAFTIVLAFASCASARLALLPLDSRPATSDLPARIASLRSEDVSAAPTTLLGTRERGADVSALGAWLEAQDGGPLVVALDTLAYGGLVQSRSSDASVEEALKRLEVVRTWRARTGQPVYAFVTLPRQPDARNRARNFEVAKEMVEWARQGVFAELHVTWDDALPSSPAPAEGARLRSDAPRNVRVYPGADEVLSMLVARALSPAARRLAVEFSDPGAATRLAPYEGISLTDSVRLHAEGTGWTVVPSKSTPARLPFGGTVSEPTEPSDLTLFVFNGGDARRAALRVSQLLRSGHLAVADVSRVNQGTLPLWADLGTLDRPRDLASLGAWGTPGNNFGTVLAHAKIFLEGADPARQDALLARQVANDVIFSARVRSALRAAVPESDMGSDDAQRALVNLARSFFPLRLADTYELQSADLPWRRSFEWRFELRRETP